MLNVFPDLLSYSLFAPIILRLVLGGFLLFTGVKIIFSEKTLWIDAFEKFHLHPGTFFATALGILESASGALILIGLYTQVGALVSTVLIVLLMVFKKKFDIPKHRDIVTYLPLLAIALFLIIFGAGKFALDFPL